MKSIFEFVYLLPITFVTLSNYIRFKIFTGSSLQSESHDANKISNSRSKLELV